MIQKKLFTKMLLVAALLGVGVNAWADDVASYNFNSQTTPFVISDAARLGASYAEYVADGGDYYVKYSCGNMNAVAFAYYDFSSSVSDAATVTIEFDFFIPEVAGHEVISIADASAHTSAGGGFTGKSNTGYGSTGAIFNLGCWRGGGANKFAINNTQNDYAGLGAWCHASVTVDNATKKVSYTITKNATTLASASDVAFLNASASRCSQIDLYIGTNASGNAIQLDNIVITKTVSAVSHNYTINAMAGITKLQELASGIANENAGYSVSVPKVIVSGGKYYVLDDGQAGMNFCLAEYTMGNADEVKEIYYTLDESVIYFQECENIQQSYASPTSSNGYACSYYATPQVVTITETGIYQLEANITGRDSNSSLDVYTADGTEAIATLAKNSGTGVKTLNFVASGNMRIGGPYYSDKFNNSKSVDYLLVRKIGTTVSKTISAAGWATYCSPYALDFTSDITNLDDAFIVEGGSAGVLTKTSVKGGKVAANTGLLLKGSEGTVTIPVAASGKDYSSTNKLTGVTAATEIAANAGYVLMNDATNGLAFYKNNNAFTVGANTAYLPANFDGSGARAFFLLFDDDMQTTGVNDVRGKMADVRGDFFDLQGRKVANPTKGLYIVNGKKAIVK